MPQHLLLAQQQGGDAGNLDNDEDGDLAHGSDCTKQRAPTLPVPARIDHLGQAVILRRATRRFAGLSRVTVRDDAEAISRSASEPRGCPDGAFQGTAAAERQARRTSARKH